MTKSVAAISWSGGKDSYLALHRTREQFEFCAAITMFNEDGSRSRSHGLRSEVIRRQALLMKMKSVCGSCSWQTYEAEFKRVLRELALGAVSAIVFGDIFTDSHRAWAERVCHECSLEAVEPLWGQPTDELLQEFLALGAEARIASVMAAKLDASWLGRPLTAAMIPEFQRLGVDPCGENGEYHTVVTRAPLFAAPMPLNEVVRVQRDGCWALDLALDSACGS